jgi:hypothetical protein
VQLAQAAAEGLDLVLVGTLLPLGQFDSLQDFLHVLEGGPEGLDDVADFFDGLGDGRGSRPGVAAGGPRNFLSDGGFGLDGRSRLRQIVRRPRRRLSGGLVGTSSPTPAAATAASAAPAARWCG